MNKLIFFDTETTGNEQKDFLCQIAYKTNGETFVELYKPPIKIPPEASAVHHITNKMVAGKPAFAESEDFKKIKTLFEDENSVVVAHNAPFDLAIIKNENIVPSRFICTLRVARHLDKEEKIPQYKLQYLRYFLDIEIEAEAHDALGDVLVLEKLFERLKKKIMDEESLDEAGAIEKMIEVSSHPSLFTKLNFGKHKGNSIEEVLQTDRGWLEWIYGEKIKSDQVDEDWIYTLKHYLGK
jgi:DNA polymerase III epsilon subunit-like protein